MFDCVLRYDTRMVDFQPSTHPYPEIFLCAPMPSVSLDKSAGAGIRTRDLQSNALPTRLSGLGIGTYACGIAPLEKEDSAPLSFCSRVFILERVMGPLYDSLGGISSVSICSAGSWYGFIRSTWTTS
ncbi:hypothetical protein TNCV_2156611 [Trichonephila clavipes]|nr:hypothetical protein TNCV_2156611 [Trichonephila clavipes]